MALLTHKLIHPAGEVGIWEITESEAFLLSKIGLFPEEQAQLDTIKGRKRIEWLAARYLVHTMSGRQDRGVFLKDEFGKPHLEGSVFDISISHSHGMAAAIAAPFPVGIDIQKLIPKIGRIAPKFMTPKERASLSNLTEIEHMHVYWGAKEALYKAYGRRQLDFCQHILIEPFEFDLNSGICYGQVKKDDYHRCFTLRYERVGEYILVYTERG